jgi:riboflavin biosynthesis pyrimidine reductase
VKVAVSIQGLAALIPRKRTSDIQKQEVRSACLNSLRKRMSVILSGIEPQFFGRSAHTLVRIPNDKNKTDVLSRNYIIPEMCLLIPVDLETN